MTDTRRITIGSLLLALITLTTISGCIVEPREGFYDHGHHRWYHEHRWRDCGDRDDHCHER